MKNTPSEKKKESVKMAKKIQFWMTDDEYQNIEQPLVDYCNNNKCSTSEAFKNAVIEYLKVKKTVKLY